VKHRPSGSENAALPHTSFVIPAHNAASTLQHTLHGVQAQTDGNWQVVIVDDASTDGTAALAAAAAAHDARVVFVPTPDAQTAPRGASATRNIGLAHASGRYVVFLDADDWVAPTYLEQMLGALRAAPDAAAAYCDYQRVMPDGAMGWPNSNEDVAASPFEVFARYCAVAIHAIVVERERVVRVGGFDTGLRICEDWDLWQRLAREGGRWVHVPIALAFYRTGPPSLSQHTARAVADAEVVVRRGFASDPRVAQPNPAWAQGVARSAERSPEISLAHFALWYAAQDAVHGRPPAALEDTLASLRLGDFWCAHSAAETVFDAACVALRVPGDQLAPRWAQFGPKLVTLIEHLPPCRTDPDAARRLLYAIERMVLQYGQWAGTCALQHTLGVRMDVRRLPDAVAPPPGVDRMQVHLHCDADALGIVELGVLGAVGPKQWAALAASKVGGRRLLALAGVAIARRPRPGVWAAAARAIKRGLLSGYLQRGQPWRARLRQAAADSWLAAQGDVTGTGSHHDALQRLRAAQAVAPSLPNAAVTVSPCADKAGMPSRRTADGRRAYWETFFEQEDPWGYESPYEHEKYAVQLELLPAAPIVRALEVACAEGHFTRSLAPRVQHLLATDVSATALGRAAARCSGAGNVEFRQLDLVADPIPGPMDLIVCSEVLYYLCDEGELRRVIDKLVAALAPGGLLISAHALLLCDDPTQTGFDWDEPFGMKTISRFLAQTPGLALQHSVRMPLYRVERYVRTDPPQAPRAEPRIEHRAIVAPIEPQVARSIVYGGAAALRSDLARSVRSTQMPVLAYHRVSALNSGPAALSRYRVDPTEFERQMGWLRRHGYHAIVSDELGWFLEQRQPFVGRPVMITFDDGYQDFADAAWPALQRHDLRAEVFVVSDLVGKAATWDRHYGDPAPLMDEHTIAALAREGVRFGSHLASHRGATGLATETLAAELLRSRHAIESWTGRAPHAVAAPYGETDERFERLATECGYRIALSTQEGAAALSSPPMRIPRIEVRGDMDIDAFARLLEASQ
jgi:peptidoglycan/xylan/chitin deacetylase (PgdA/CDA1 family)